MVSRICSVEGKASPTLFLKNMPLKEPTLKRHILLRTSSFFLLLLSAKQLYLAQYQKIYAGQALFFIKNLRMREGWRIMEN
jgi:hypothetical protein